MGTYSILWSPQRSGAYFWCFVNNSQTLGWPHSSLLCPKIIQHFLTTSCFCCCPKRFPAFFVCSLDVNLLVLANTLGYRHHMQALWDAMCKSGCRHKCTWDFTTTTNSNKTEQRPCICVRVRDDFLICLFRPELVCRDKHTYVRPFVLRNVCVAYHTLCVWWCLNYAQRMHVCSTHKRTRMHI